MEQIEKLINKVSGQNTKIGIWACNVTTGKEFAYNENLSIFTASIIKVPVALTLFHLYERGVVDIDKLINLKTCDIRDLGPRDTGILRILPRNFKVTLRVLTSLMLSISDNAATNLVLEQATMKKVNLYMKRLGFPNTKLNHHTNDDWLDFEADFDIGSTTAKEMGMILAGIMEDLYLHKKHNKEILNYMGGLNISNRILRNLPTAKNYWDKGVRIKEYYWKGGTWPRLGVCTDLVGLITDKNEKIVISIFTEHIEDSNKYLRHVAVDHAAPVFIAQSGKLLFEYLY